MGQRADELERRVRETSGVSRNPDEQDEDLDESTAAAREEIELTRAEMTSTIDAIQDRLDPEVLSEQAKDTAHDVTDHAIREAKEAAREITDTPSHKPGKPFWTSPDRPRQRYAMRRLER